MAKWRDDEIEILRKLYPLNTAGTLAGILDRKPSSIYNKAKLLGIAKAPEFWTSGTSGRFDGIKGGNTRFKPGLVPWNKGTHYVAGGRSAETRFKKGRPAHEARNYVPIGSLRISKDGYLERKVTDDPALVPTRRWVAVHRLVWQAANGPIPEGHIVAFKPGQKTAVLEEITVDKLDCISLRENMRRNTIHNLPKPLAEAVQLRGALMRKINHATKEANP